MRTLEEIDADIKEVKANLKEIAKVYGKQSVQYAEELECLDNLYSEYEFSELHL